MTTFRVIILGLLAVAPIWAQENAENLFQWRGPFQTGVSAEKYENWDFNETPIWKHDLSGRGCPVIVDGRLYSFGYTGSGAEMQIVLACLNAENGELIWEKRVNDFISDTIYSRYGTGSPVVDRETRNVYVMTSTGLFMAFDKDGKPLWEHSLMEEFGRLTFPNGRTGAPVIEGDLVIVRGITSFWGKQGPARDRFYAFDKRSGEAVWSSEPGVAPKDSSFSTPVFETRDGKRVFYAGTGCGNVVCVNACNGKPLWRYQFSKGGVNSTLAVSGEHLVCIHGKENLDTAEEGRMIGLKLPTDLGGDELAVLPASAETWRLPLVSFSSSPAVHNGRTYILTKTGTLACVEVTTGKLLWNKKLDSSNLHSSVLYVDGILYAPLHSGTLYVLRPGDNDAEILHKIQLDGNCLGAPAVWKGHLYVHTTKHLYCFKMNTGKISYAKVDEPVVPAAGKANELMIVPNEILLTPGGKAPLKAFAVDASGFRTGSVTPDTWEPWIPPTAKVKARLNAKMEGNALTASPDAKTSAGMFRATGGGLSGTTRGRVLPSQSLNEDFEGFELSVDHPLDAGVKFAYPPLPWIGGRFKWEVRDLDGNKVLRKTLDRVLFQRATTFIGAPSSQNYTLQADVMTDGNRRIKGDVGLINQRYLISLKGNWNQIEISSNHERIKEAVAFPIKAKTWYTLKTQVNVAADGSGTVRGKAWPRGETEPDAWTIEVRHKIANRKGAPGIFGFSPQSQKPVFVDNIKITPNS